MTPTCDPVIVRSWAVVGRLSHRGVSPHVLISLTDASFDASLSSALEAVGFLVDSGRDVHAMAADASADYPVVIVDDSLSIGCVPHSIWCSVPERPTRRFGGHRQCGRIPGGGSPVACADSADWTPASTRSCGTIQSVQASGVAIPRDMVGAVGRRWPATDAATGLNTVAGPIDVTDREWEIMQLCSSAADA